MTFVLVCELFAVYVFAGMLVVLFVFATWDWLQDQQSQRRADGYLSAEREAFDLDAQFALPAREPRP